MQIKVITKVWYEFLIIKIMNGNKWVQTLLEKIMKILQVFLLDIIREVGIIVGN